MTAVQPMRRSPARSSDQPRPTIRPAPCGADFAALTLRRRQWAGRGRRKVWLDLALYVRRITLS
jgi:hypothetical protein